MVFKFSTLKEIRRNPTQFLKNTRKNLKIHLEEFTLKKIVVVEAMPFKIPL